MPEPSRPDDRSAEKTRSNHAKKDQKRRQRERLRAEATKLRAIVERDRHAMRFMRIALCELTTATNPYAVPPAQTSGLTSGEFEEANSRLVEARAQAERAVADADRRLGA